MGDTDPPKYAHFEDTKSSTLKSLYERHAEVARDIHQDVLRQFTGNNDLTVDLVRESLLLPDEDTIDKLAQYDVVSYSTTIGLLSIRNAEGMASLETAQLYKQRFAEEDMPIYVVAAGNGGKTPRATNPRVADLARNSLVVGEAQNKPSQQPYLEAHSSRINPTLASDNPFNRGVKYQFYDTNPSLGGHEDLVRDWILGQDVKNAVEASPDYDPEKSIFQHSDYDELKMKVEDLARTDEGRASLQGKVDFYMENPEALHAVVMKDIRKKYDVDENGFTSDVGGTSFSAPEQAGYVSGVLYEQAQREEKGLPILNKDEITTLVKMATIDTQKREGIDKPMNIYKNADGHQFVTGAGHGVFQPEMFRALLDKSYQIIEKNPDINRDSVTAVMDGEIGEEYDGRQLVTLNLILPEDSKIVIDRILVDMEYEANIVVQRMANLKKLDSYETIGLQQAMGEDGKSFFAWSRVEHNFGQNLASEQDWNLRLANDKDTNISDAGISVYGYNQGGLMDQMMDYSKDLALKIVSDPLGVAPVTLPESPDIPIKLGGF